MPGNDWAYHSNLRRIRKGHPVILFVAMLLIASFLLHFAWEMWQVPFFVGMEASPHADVVWLCTRAALGDVGIALLALTPLLWRDGIRNLFALQLPALSVYLVTGLLITIGFEYAATEVLARWEYKSAMPTLPGIGTGLTPILQWLLLPPLALVFARYFSLGWWASGGPS